MKSLRVRAVAKAMGYKYKRGDAKGEFGYNYRHTLTPIGDNFEYGRISKWTTTSSFDEPSIIELLNEDMSMDPLGK